MKFIFFLIFIVCGTAKAATEAELQSLNVTNLLKNAGFENGIAKYTPSVSNTVQLVSGTSALFESASLRFTATASSQTVQTALYTIPTGLVSGSCESSISYQSGANVYRMRVLNQSGTVLAQTNLAPVSAVTTSKVFFNCTQSATTSIRADVISSATAGAQGITYDQNHLGSLISITKGSPAASYYLGANLAVAANNAINFDTREFDNTLAVVTGAAAWRFTAQTEGLYEINGYLDNETASGGAVGLYKNGSLYKTFIYLDSAGVNGFAVGNVVLFLRVNDFVDIRPLGFSTTFAGGALTGASYIQVKKLGN